MAADLSRGRTGDRSCQSPHARRVSFSHRHLLHHPHPEAVRYFSGGGLDAGVIRSSGRHLDFRRARPAAAGVVPELDLARAAAAWRRIWQPATPFARKAAWRRKCSSRQGELSTLLEATSSASSTRGSAPGRRQRRKMHARGEDGVRRAQRRPRRGYTRPPLLDLGESRSGTPRRATSRSSATPAAQVSNRTAPDFFVEQRRHWPAELGEERALILDRRWRQLRCGFPAPTRRSISPALLVRRLESALWSRAVSRTLRDPMAGHLVEVPRRRAEASWKQAPGLELSGSRSRSSSTAAALSYSASTSAGLRPPRRAPAPAGCAGAAVPAWLPERQGL